MTDEPTPTEPTPEVESGTAHDVDQSAPVSPVPAPPPTGEPAHPAPDANAVARRARRRATAAFVAAGLLLVVSVFVAADREPRMRFHEVADRRGEHVVPFDLDDMGEMDGRMPEMDGRMRERIEEWRDHGFDERGGRGPR